MAYFHTTVLDNQIKALPTVDTASGSVATFDTDLTENLIECECEIVHIGNGGGTPQSPNPITVYNALNLSHSGFDTSNPTITNIPFGRYVADGVLNVLTGELYLTLGALDIGNTDWTYSTSGQYFQTQNEIADCKKSTSNYTTFGLICPIYQDVIWNTIGDTNYTMALGYYNKRYIRIINHDYTDVNSFKTAMSGVCLIYPLETPYIIHLGTNPVQALLNENNIWCDTNGDTEVKFILSVGKKIA